MLFEDKGINKKRKIIQKGSDGLGFENFSQRIKSLINFDTFEKPTIFKKKKKKKRNAGEMVKKTVTKNKLSQLNDKRLKILLCRWNCLPSFSPSKPS